MRVVVGILCSATWLLYVGQIITVANFGLAQRLGLQETSDHADPLFSHVELWAARWDLWWLWTLPLAGILKQMDHPWWPDAAMIGGGAFVDAGGREAAKIFGLREQGVRVGSSGQRVSAMGVFLYFITIGCVASGLGLLEVT